MNESMSEQINLPRPSQESPGLSPKPKLRFPAWIAGVVMLSAAVGAGSGAGLTLLLDDSGTTSQNQAQTGVGASQTGISGSPVSVANVYAKVRPSVVKISGTSSTGGGTGSGIVIDTEGHIVTNYHVINGFDQLDVRLSDGSTRSATVIGTDPGDDLALIKIDPTGLDLTPVTLGNIENVQIGDAVVAVGNPLDLEATLTEGVVSGMSRILNGGNGGRPLRQLIQTDTAINPGNSGGGLFNLNGELIGITNAIENPSGQASFAGIGYAIPVSTLQRFLPDLLAGKDVSHARLGVSLVDLTPAIASKYGLSIESGVLIGDVASGSGASVAGLRGTSGNQAGDVVLAIDGQPVKTFEDLAGYVDTKQPGDKVELTISRDGKEMKVTITLDRWTS